MILLDKVDKEELYIIDDLFSSAVTSIFCFVSTFATGIFSMSPLGAFVSLKNVTYQTQIFNVFTCLLVVANVIGTIFIHTLPR